MIKTALAAAAASLAIVPATASADPPWSAPSTLAGTGFYDASLAMTQDGTPVVASAGAVSGLVEAPTLLTTIGADGRPAGTQLLKINGAWIASYAAKRVVVVGVPPVKTGAEARRAPVLISTGEPGKLSPPRGLSGSSGQHVAALAGGPGNVVAFVTASYSGNRRRVVWVSRGGVVKRLLTIKVSAQGRGASVAVGSKGDVLVAWEDKHKIFSRHIGPSGRAAAAHTLGAGIQASIQTAYDASGRQEVAWLSQRVDEGDAVSNATISYTSAARGHGFGAAQVIGHDDIIGTGRYVSYPGVRLVPSGSDSSVLAFTVYDGANFRVQQANAAGGTVQAPQTLSPAGVDAVLGDLAYARAGGTLVLWRSGTRGADPSGPQRVFAGYRPAGQFDFGAPEAISGAAQIPSAPTAAINPITGVSVAAFGDLTPSVQVSVRPAR